MCWPIAAIIRGHYHQRLIWIPSYLRLRPWVRVVCAVDIAFLLIFLMVLTSGGISVLSSKTDFKFHAIQSFGVLGALGTVLYCWLLFARGETHMHGSGAKSGIFYLLLACLGFVWFSYHWNLLNFNYELLNQTGEAERIEQRASATLDYVAP